MIRALSDEEKEQLNKEIVEWVKMVLESKYGTYIYNILLELQQFIEKLDYEN